MLQFTVRPALTAGWWW